MTALTELEEEVAGEVAQQATEAIEAAVERSEPEAIEVAAEEAEEPAEAAEEARFSRDDMKTRAMGAEAKIIDQEKRTVRIAVSSEEPVDRSFGAEILDHSEKSIDLAFARSGRMPLLLDHDPRQQIGVVESVDLDGSARRLRANTQKQP